MAFVYIFNLLQGNEPFTALINHSSAPSFGLVTSALSDDPFAVQGLKVNPAKQAVVENCMFW